MRALSRATSAVARRAAAAAALLLFGAAPASAHRLDEYLQATTISVQKDHITAQLRLTPGVAVFPAAFAAMDADGDGVLSAAEQRAYAEVVLRDLSLTLDGVPLRPRLVAATFPTAEAMREGLGEIQIEFDAAVPAGGADRRLTFENRHQRRIAVYLVNALVPRDPDIRIVGQDRNDEQSVYRLDYTQAGAGPALLSLAWWSGPGGWLGVVALLPMAWFAVRRQQRAERRVEGADAAIARR